MTANEERATGNMEALTEALNNLANEIITKMFAPAGLDPGRVGILIHRYKGAYGYCYSGENWKINDQGVREIGITDTCIMMGLWEIMTTIAHELIHSTNNKAGIVDCRNGYHNRHFAKVCDAIGLEYESGVKKHGILNHTQCPEIFKTIRNAMEKDDLQTIISAKVALETRKGSSVSGRNLSVHQCPKCGNKARAIPTIDIICKRCKLDMEVIE